MMKVLAALLFVAVAVADYSYTGYFLNTPASSTFLVDWSTDSTTGAYTCTPYTTTYYFNNFTVNFATAGVRYISVASYYTPYIAVYTGLFNPATPCANNIPYEFESSGYTYGSQDNYAPEDMSSGGYYFNANQDYSIIVLASSGAAAATTSIADYAWGANVYDPLSTQVQGSATWNAPYYSSSGVITAGASSDPEPYATFLYTAATSGYYDVGVMAVNNTAQDTPEVTFAFASGALTPAQIAALTTAQSPYLLTSSTASDQGAWFFYVWMTAGQQYTFVASNSEYTYSGSNYVYDGAHFGFFAVPSVVKGPYTAPSTLQYYTQPDYTSSPKDDFADTNPTCTASTTTSRSSLGYVTASFRSAGNVALVVFDNPSSTPYNQYSPGSLVANYDSYLFLYRGYNNTAGATGPTACPITFGSYLGAVEYDGLLVDIEAAIDPVHSMVVTPYSTSYAPTNYATTYVPIWTFGGVSLNSAPGYVAPTAAPAPTTSTPTTSTPTTSTPTTSAPTTSSCAARTYTATVSFTAPGGCSNSSVVALSNAINGGLTGNANVTCTTTGTTTTLVFTSRFAANELCSFTSINTTALIEVFQGYGFTNIVVATPTPTTSTPSTATTAGTTSAAVSVVSPVSCIAYVFVAIFALVLLL